MSLPAHKLHHVCALLQLFSAHTRPSGAFIMMIKHEDRQSSRGHPGASHRHDSQCARHRAHNAAALATAWDTLRIPQRIPPRRRPPCKCTVVHGTTCALGGLMLGCERGTTTLLLVFLFGCQASNCSWRARSTASARFGSRRWHACASLPRRDRQVA